MSDGILEAHALLSDVWELVFVDSGQVVSIEAEIAALASGTNVNDATESKYSQSFEPAVHFVRILIGSFTGDSALDDRKAIAD